MKEAGNDEERLRNTGSNERSSRAMQDRAVTERRDLSDSERIEMFRMQHFQHVLPDLPKIPGYHTCWLSTTSQNDTVTRRQMLGYEPISREDVPGWDYDKTSLKTGEYAGLIGVNEMVAYKIRDELYQAFMTEAHFNRPMEQDSKLIHDIKAIEEQAKSGKSYIEREEGVDDIERGLTRTKKPMFA